MTGEPLRLERIVGEAADPAIAERLHALAHANAVESIVLGREDAARHRLRVKTDRGRDCTIALPRSQRLRNGLCCCSTRSAPSSCACVRRLGSGSHQNRPEILQATSTAIRVVHKPLKTRRRGFDDSSSPSAISSAGPRERRLCQHRSVWHLPQAQSMASPTSSPASSTSSPMPSMVLHPLSNRVAASNAAAKDKKPENLLRLVMVLTSPANEPTFRDNVGTTGRFPTRRRSAKPLTSRFGRALRPRPLLSAKLFEPRGARTCSRFGAKQHDSGRFGQVPLKLAGRFSRKACMPSRLSALANRSWRLCAPASGRPPGSRPAPARIASLICITASGGRRARSRAIASAASTTPASGTTWLTRPSAGLGGGDRATGETDPHGVKLADRASETLGAAGARHDADPHLRLAELCALAGDDHVAAHRELEAGAERIAVDRGDHWLGVRAIAFQ